MKKRLLLVLAVLTGIFLLSASIVWAAPVYPGDNYCRDFGPCSEGLGDCDSDAECASGLICVNDVGANYGWPSNVDVCEGHSALVPKTGQTYSYRQDDDGFLQKGVASPSPRFTDNGDGTVLDNLTGLMWAKDANLYGNKMTWNQAIDYANNLSLGSSCGGLLTDWRLPNVKELQSLIDFGQIGLALPSGHPFLNLAPSWYWSSTTYTKLIDKAWHVSIFTGHVDNYNKDIIYSYVWPVRSDN